MNPRARNGHVTVLPATPANLPERRGAPPKGAEIKLVEPDAVRIDEGSVMDVASALAQFRATIPLVHCLTNTVVPQIITSILLAAGTTPAMIGPPEEAELFAGIASVVLINVGNGSSEQHVTWRATVSAVHRAGAPWVLDPVVVDVLSVRTALVRELSTLSSAATRGSASEVLDLTGAGAEGRGVDLVDPIEAAVEVARGLTDGHNIAVAVLGEADVVISALRTMHIHSGGSLMSLVIGVGCSLDALVAAAFGATQEHSCPHDAVVVAHVLSTAASITAGRDAKGPVSFEIAWCDIPYTLLPDEVAPLVAVREV